MNGHKFGAIVSDIIGYIDFIRLSKFAVKEWLPCEEQQIQLIG